MAGTLRWLIARIRSGARGLDAEFKILVQNSSWIFMSNAARTVLSFVRAMVIARGLGVSGYGTYVLIFALTTTVREFFDLNISSALIKFGADYRSQERADLLVALTKVGLLGSAVLGLFAVGIATLLGIVGQERLIGVPDLHWYVFACAVAVSVQLFDALCFALLRLHYRFRVNAILNVALGVVDLVLISIVLWLYPGQLKPFLVAMISATFLNSVVINGVALWELWPQVSGHLRAPIRLLAFQRRELVSFVLSNSGTRTLQALMNRGDVILLGWLSTPVEVGFYDIGRRVAYAMIRMIDPVAVSIFPQTSRLIAEQRFAELSQLLHRSVTLLAPPAALCVLAALLLGKLGITTMLGSQFAPAAMPLFIHLVAASVYTVFFWAAPVLLGFGMTMFRFVLAAVALVVGIAIALMLGPQYGASGVAIASMVAKLTLLLVSVAAAIRALRARMGEPAAEGVAVAVSQGSLG